MTVFAAQLHQNQEKIKKTVKFTREMSHRVRTPLNTVFLGLEYCLAEGKNLAVRHGEQRLEGILETAQDVYESCVTANSILDEFSTFSVMNDGRLSLNIKELHPLKLLTTTARAFKVRHK